MENTFVVRFANSKTEFIKGRNVSFSKDEILNLDGYGRFVVTNVETFLTHTNSDNLTIHSIVEVDKLK